MPKAKKKDLDKMARVAARGTVKDALLDAGYAPSVANRGVAGLPEGEREKFRLLRRGYALKKLGKFEDLGKGVKPDQQENIVRGALLDNVAKGKDKATASLKMLGSDKRVAMFEPENSSGVIVITTAQLPPLPSDLAALTVTPSLEQQSPCTITASNPPELTGRRGDCGWDHNFKAPDAPEAPKDR